MTAESGCAVSDCGDLRQGDVIGGLSLPDADSTSHSGRFAILSQTCDVVQASKSRCLVAPVIESSEEMLRAARKGRKPLHLFLSQGPGGDAAACVVDMEQATSLPKSELLGKPILVRYVVDSSSEHAGKVAARVGRAFSRFPFPDEVYPFFGELRSRIQSKSGSPSPFGQVVDLVEDLRVGASQWVNPERKLTLYVVIAEERLITRDDFDPGWQWNQDRVHGLRADEEFVSLNLNRVSELILANEKRDRTTLAQLWLKFGETMVAELLTPNLNNEVSECIVNVLSDTEMNYRDFQRTESLDLEVLSDSTAPRV